MRGVEINRALTPEQVLAKTNRKHHVDPAVVANAPRGEGQQVNVIFFEPDPSAYDGEGRLNDESLSLEYEKKGLMPVDLSVLAAVADEAPVATHWLDQDRNWCHAAFVNVEVGGHVEERVHVNRSTRGWSNFWKKFAGVQK